MAELYLAQVAARHLGGNDPDEGLLPRPKLFCDRVELDAVLAAYLVAVVPVYQDIASKDYGVPASILLEIFLEHRVSVLVQSRKQGFEFFVYSDILHDILLIILA